MKFYMLGKGVAKYYRNNVKGNHCADINLIQKKLTRNIMLGKEYALSNREKLFIYKKGRKAHSFRCGMDSPYTIY